MIALGERLVEVYGSNHALIAAHLKTARGTRRTDSLHLPESVIKDRDSHQRRT